MDGSADATFLPGLVSGIEETLEKRVKGDTHTCTHAHARARTHTHTARQRPLALSIVVCVWRQ